MDNKSANKNGAFKKKLHDIIFYTDTPAGKAFDVVLLIAILLSILAVMLETVPYFKEEHRTLLYWFEIVITILFTAEYILRIYVTDKPLKYITSFMGMVDLLSILPSFLMPFVANSHYLGMIRTVRLIRVFRILKLTRFIKGLNELKAALLSSRYKIIVFLTFILVVVLLMGTLLYVLEGPENGFTSIPLSVYWAIVTLTTVGYGDISPQTPAGQFVASLIMIIGYGIIAVPTGIVTSEYTLRAKTKQPDDHVIPTNLECEKCGAGHHNEKAKYCYNCGAILRH